MTFFAGEAYAKVQKVQAELQRMAEAREFHEEANVTPPHGLTMYGFNVLVKPNPVDEKIGSVFVPDEYKDKLAYGITEGELVAISAVAFSYETWPAGTRLPQIGDQVTFGKFVGAKVKGNDGIEYRVMEDKEILAVRA
jgi:co-chaperonin GroES (HSP10)